MGRGKKRPGLAAAVLEGQDAALEAQADAWLAGATATPHTPATTQSTASEQRLFINTLNARIKRKLPPNYFDLDQVSKTRAEGKSLGVLSPMEQRKLVRIANEYSGPGRESIRERAAELLILTNAGFVEDTIRGHQARGLEEEVLRQECRLAIYDAIGRFDHQNGASFLAFAEWRMRGAISEAIRSDSRLVRLKSRASEIADRVQRAIKDFEKQGIELNELTPQMLADKTGDKVERVTEVLPWVTNATVRLDAPIATKDGEIDVASAVADPLVDVEGEIIDENLKQALKGALGHLPPYERRVVELYYNLEGEQDLQQKDLFDGVYISTDAVEIDGVTYPAGTEFSAEQSVIADRRDRQQKGITGNPDEDLSKNIVTATQKTLNGLHADGKVVFKPSTKEARELYELSRLSVMAKDNPVAAERAEDEYVEQGVFSKKTLDKLQEISGVPPTSATIQETLQRAYTDLAPHLSSLKEFHTYRGDNALEHSEAACDLVRDELKRAAQAAGGVLYVAGYGRLSSEEIDRLKPGRTAKGGIGRKGALRKVAELTGHVDAESGRLTFTPDGDAKPKPKVKAQQKKGKAAVEAPSPDKKTVAVKPIDLITAGHLSAGEGLFLFYKGREYKATLRADGSVELEDGRVFSALSGAAEAAKGVRADAGWNSWHVDRDGKRVKLFDLRDKYRAERGEQV